MPVKIRLMRRGRRRLAIYDVIVADSRAPRDGRFIEKIGTYNPNTNPASIDMDDTKAFDWVMKGAQPTDTVRAMLSYRGVMMKKHLQVGVNKGAIKQEEADKKFEVWVKGKESKIQGKVDKLAKLKADKQKIELEAETKVKEARTEALKKKAQEVEAALVKEIKQRSVEGSEDEDVTEIEETQVTSEKQKDETPVTETKEETKAEVSAEVLAERVKEGQDKKEG